MLIRHHIYLTKIVHCPVVIAWRKLNNYLYLNLFVRRDSIKRHLFPRKYVIPTALYVFFITRKTHTRTHPRVRPLRTCLDRRKQGINPRPRKIHTETHSCVRKDEHQNLNSGGWNCTPITPPSQQELVPAALYIRVVVNRWISFISLFPLINMRI